MRKTYYVKYVLQGEAKRKRELWKEKAREMFDEVDDDKSGLLDVGEIIRLAKMLGVDLDLAQAQQAMEEMDEDQSGEVDFDEFYEWFKLANGDDDEIESGERKKGEPHDSLMMIRFPRWSGIFGVSQNAHAKKSPRCLQVRETDSSW